MINSIRVERFQSGWNDIIPYIVQSSRIVHLEAVTNKLRDSMNNTACIFKNFFSETLFLCTMGENELGKLTNFSVQSR